jgi:hypothetical protein
MAPSGEGLPRCLAKFFYMRDEQARESRPVACGQAVPDSQEEGRLMAPGVNSRIGQEAEPQRFVTQPFVEVDQEAIS